MNPRIVQLFLDLLAEREEGGEALAFRRLRRFAVHEPDFARLWVSHALASDATVSECATALVMLVSEWEGPQTDALLEMLEAYWRPEAPVEGESPGLDAEVAERMERLPEVSRGQLEGIFAGLSRLEARAHSGERLGGSPAQLFTSGLSSALLSEIRARAKPALKTATVNHQQLNTAIRDSSDAFFPVPTQDPAVATVERVMARCANISLGQAEPLVVLRYQPGQQYRWHRDYRPPDQPGGPAEIRRFGQRGYTAILYLNDDYEGGETAFRDWRLEVRGRPGQVLGFPSVDAEGRIDPSSIHRGVPVTHGEKWIASLWFRDRKLWHRRGLM